MGEWKTYRLGDIIEIVSGFSYKGEYLGKGDKYLLGMGCVSFNEQFLEKGLRPYSGYCDKRYYAKEGDIVLATRQQSDNMPILGMPAIIPKKYKGKQMIVGANLYRVINKSKDFSNDFIYWLLKSPDYVNYIKSCQTGTTVRMITKANIENYTFICPDRESRLLISHFLWTLENKIELNRRINANLEAQAQALFKSWFVDFEPFRDGPFVDSELGKIPQGWKVGTLSEIGDVIGGGTPSKIVSEYYADNGIAWITPKDLSTNNCKFTSKGETDISELGYKNSSAKLMPRGSVLFSSRAPIGYISIAKNEICTNQGFKSIVPKKVGTCFIYYLLRNNTSKIESMASGSTFKEVSGGLMKSLKVIIPSNKILTAFEEAIQPLFNMQEHNEDENAHLSALRDTLLPKLMSGNFKSNINN